MGIIFVYLGNSKVKDQLINLLDLMFKSSKNASEKITALHNDFGIDLTQEGKIESAFEMFKDGVDLDKVAKYTKLSLSIIQELAKQNKLI